MTIGTIARLDYPAAVVKMNVPPNMQPRLAGFRLGACQKEPWTVAFIEAMPAGSVLYDCGANVGSYALLAAALGHTVVAIEPAYQNYEQLCVNAALNNALDKLTILPVALAEKPGLVWFQHSDLTPGSASHQIGQPHGQKPVFYHRQQVMAFPLDVLVLTFGLPWPTHIKLDVDGGESVVLSGMQQVLRGEHFRALLVEMPLKAEEAIKEKLAGWDLAPVSRFDERGGKPIGIAYSVFTRAGAPGA